MKKSVSLFISAAMFFCSCFCLGAATPVAAENRYASVKGGTINEHITDTVYYDHRDITDYFTNQYRLPQYFASGIANSCAINAGGVIIANFDRTYDELIPNHTAILFMGSYTYSSQDEAVNAMFQELYTRMGSTSEGTTVAGYKQGMTSYVQNKGRNIEITGMYNKSSLDMSAYMAAFKAGKLATVFLSGFSVVYESGITTHDGYDTIDNTIAGGHHTVAAYGYRNIRYYDASNNLVQEDNYLYVHTGFSSGTLGMIRLNKYTTVDDGYIINVT